MDMANFKKAATPISYNSRTFCSKMDQTWPQRDNMVQSRQDIDLNGPEVENKAENKSKCFKKKQMS